MTLCVALLLGLNLGMHGTQVQRALREVDINRKLHTNDTWRSKYLIDRRCCPPFSSDQGVQSGLNRYWEEQHSHSQMQVRKQVVAHSLNLLAEGTPRLEGGIRQVGRGALHLQGLEVLILSDK